MKVKAPCAEQWHLLVENLSEFDHLAPLDELDCLQHGRELDMVPGAALVTGAHFEGQRSFSAGGDQVGA